eukprot:scaffold24495_cov111-Isochrysis_galbana.AAC.2
MQNSHPVTQLGARLCHSRPSGVDGRFAASPRPVLLRPGTVPGGREQLSSAHNNTVSSATSLHSREMTCEG